MSVEQTYEIEFNSNSTKNFSKYSKNKEDIISAYLEIESKFKEHQVDHARTKEKFVFFDLYVEALPSTVLNPYGPLCYPASIEKELLLFIEEVSKEYSLLDSK